MSNTILTSEQKEGFLTKVLLSGLILTFLYMTKKYFLKNVLLEGHIFSMKNLSNWSHSQRIGECILAAGNTGNMVKNPCF